MKINQYRCDCCRKTIEIDQVMKLKLPISCNKDGMSIIKPHKMDICGQCAVKIMGKYYEVAKEHNSSGIRGIVVGDE